LSEHVWLSTLWIPSEGQFEYLAQLLIGKAEVADIFRHGRRGSHELKELERQAALERSRAIRIERDPVSLAPNVERRIALIHMHVEAGLQQRLGKTQAAQTGASDRNRKWSVPHH
jgi:hypothetical protein